MKPGEVVSQDGFITVNAGLKSLSLTVRNTSVRPVRVSSHYPFWLANRKLEFDRAAANGCRLDIMAGASVRWAAGETREVRLVRFHGDISATEQGHA